MAIQISGAEAAELKRYLLGQTAAIERDEIEDRFASDPEYLQMYEEVERSLVLDYASRALETEEATLFERNYLVTEQRRERLTLIRALKAIDAERTGNSATELTRKNGALMPAWVGLAVLTFLTLSLFFFLRHRSSPRPGQPSAALPSVASRAPGGVPATNAHSNKLPPATSPQVAENRPTPNSSEHTRKSFEAPPVRISPPSAIRTTQREPPSVPALSVPDPDQTSDFAFDLPAAPLFDNRGQQSIPKTNTFSGRKLRVAVIGFGYGAVLTSVKAMFGSNQDVGRGIGDLLTNELVDAGNYRVVDRTELDKVLKEQNFSNSDRVDAFTASKIGSSLGADIVIIGDVTQFGRDDKNYGAGGAGGHWGTYGLGNMGLRKAKAVVEVTARIVDVNTGEILASATGHGQSQRSGTNMLGGGASGWTGGGGHLDMGSSNFSQSMLGEAVKQSVTQLAINLDAKAPKVAAAQPLDGLVADATNGEIIVNVGSGSGVKVGDKLSITRVDRTIKDPVTGKVLRTIESPVGFVVVTDVDANSASGTFSGTEVPKVGDKVTRANN